MTSTKRQFSCGNCTYRTVKWIGCCPECQQWGTIAELANVPTGPAGSRTTVVKAVSISDVADTRQKRLISGVPEWDRVVGGGLIPGSFYVLTGDPGIGKSTLLLQISNKLCMQHVTLYVSTEESLEQVCARARRITETSDSLLFADCNTLDAIMTLAQQYCPQVLIIDSIQNLYTGNTAAYPGSVAQLREAAFALMQLAKQNDICVVVTGHITKDGIIAGPKTLEHMVDGVLYLQGDPQFHIRTLRAVKNRFGSLGEIGFFQMVSSGLEAAPDLNKELLKHASDAPGSCLIGTFEGSRALLVELQALVVPSKLNMPQRIISGVDHKQVVLIAALLEKHLHIKLSAHDIFFKTSGGFKVTARYADLGIALALLSSYFQSAPHKQYLAMAEISITGDVRPLPGATQLWTYAQKLGISHSLIARDNTPSKSTQTRIKHVLELLQLFE